MIQVQATETALPLHLTVNKAGVGGVTGLVPTVAVRIVDSPPTGLYLDWADATFKSSGWTTKYQTMPEMERGHYERLLNVAALGLNPGTKLVSEYHVDDGGAVKGEDADLFLLSVSATAAAVAAVQTAVNSNATTLTAVASGVSSVQATVATLDTRTATMATDVAVAKTDIALARKYATNRVEVIGDPAVEYVYDDDGVTLLGTHALADDAGHPILPGAAGLPTRRGART